MTKTHDAKQNFMVLGLVLVLAGCGAEPRTPTAQQMERMTQFREQLKTTLGPDYELPIPQGTPTQIKRGEELYLQICAPCHGVRGHGDGHTAQGLIGNPTDLTDSEQASFYSERARLYIIRKGVTGTPMMGWENVLTDSDIDAVYHYIHSLIERK